MTTEKSKVERLVDVMDSSKEYEHEEVVLERILRETRIKRHECNRQIVALKAEIVEEIIATGKVS